jgi:RNA polymerase sigma factor (sigma-70 family)
MGASRKELEAVYRARYLGYRRTLATVTGSYESAHDVVQEAFARALLRRRQFRGDAPLEAWVWRIALRVALDERAQSLRVLFDDTYEVGLVEPAHDPELAEALRGLPPRRRLIFFLRYFADLSYQEIAEVCEISVGTVSATIAQARSELAEMLQGVQR